MAVLFPLKTNNLGEIISGKSIPATSLDTHIVIENGGGIDGGYGNATQSAVVTYQKKKWPYDSSQWDGRVGRKTWTKIAGDLNEGYSNSEGIYLCYNNGRVMYVDRRAEGYTYYSCDINGVKDRFIE